MVVVGNEQGSARGTPWFGDVIAQSARKLASLLSKTGNVDAVGPHGACRAMDWLASLVSGGPRFSASTESVYSAILGLEAQACAIIKLNVIWLWG